MTAPLSPAQALALAARLRAEAGEPEPARVSGVVRSRIEAAQVELRVALDALRQDGFDETARDLSRIERQLAVWTQPDGMLDYLGVVR